MRIAGIELDKPKNIIIPIIRGDEEVIFQASCLTDFGDLEKVLVEPKPPTRMMRGEITPSPVMNDPKYLKDIESHSGKRLSWMIAKSLLATEGLTWDTVDFTNPETFGNYEQELRDSGFNEFQIMQIVRGCMEANGLSSERVVEARKRFLAMKQGIAPSNSLLVEQPNISSGDSAKDSE